MTLRGVRAARTVRTLTVRTALTTRTVLTTAVSAALALVGVVLFASPAGAVIEPPNTIGCSGSARITDDDGKVFNADAADTKVVVPRSGSAAWEGSLGTVTHNHFGAVNLELGPTTIELGSWGVSKNDKDEKDRSGVRDLPSTLGGVPPGRYVVSGYHQGDEGRCEGFVEIEVQGNPLGHPAGAAAAVGTLIGGGMLAFAGRPKANAA